ncbi:uncharacterized protein LOC116429660 [Nomia melanderi]|uniref:uncharacterized protein LOC116429660 n=1 Tax=Nomia melanderi TaxID=2448451 RepID=UPI001304717A|nr:uncharacterized protein LOC116429660 [Nomia melanderi]
MNPSKWNFVSVVMFSLISTVILDDTPGSGQQQQKHQAPIAPTAGQSTNVPPYWDHLLRESVLKTISPPPSSNINLYKRLLDAPFYGGPFPVLSNDTDRVVLSRGDVYYLPNSNWILCQEGCVNCEVCADHTHPVLKWVLRRVKRRPWHGQPRQDFQLTLIPQKDGSYLMKNLWPRSFVYVTTPADQIAYLNGRIGHHLDTHQENLENSFTGQHRKSTNFWRFVERNSANERPVNGEQSKATEASVSLGNSRRSQGATPTLENTTQSGVSNSERTTRVKPSDVSMENSSTISESGRDRLGQLLPKLILGTDQLGQKHLVHVVPADAPGNVSLTNVLARGALNATGLGQHRNKTTYQRILRRIYDSLSSNRRSIESFLEPPPRTEGHYVEDHQLQETRNVLKGLKQLNRLHRNNNERSRNGTVDRGWPHVLNWKRQRRTSEIGTSALISSEIDVNRTLNNSHNLDSKVQSNMMNVTFNGDSNKNGNNFEHFNPNVINRYYYSRNVSDHNLRTNSDSGTRQETQFVPSKFKIIITTESIMKSMKNSELITNFWKSVGRDSDQLNYNGTSMQEGPLLISLINKSQQF